jgi:hypothetical protein
MDELAKRIETALKGIIDAALPNAQVLTYGDLPKAEKEHVIIRVLQGDEDPPGTGIFLCDCAVGLHGNFSGSDVEAIEAIFYAGYEFSEILRTAGAGAYLMPQGLAVDLNTGSKASAGLDADRQYSFTVYAQKIA